MTPPALAVRARANLDPAKLTFKGILPYDIPEKGFGDPESAARNSESIK
jgi:hypothetical protein